MNKEEAREKMLDYIKEHGGKVAFHFFQTYGFPFELFMEELCQKSLTEQFGFISYWNKQISK